MSSRRFSFGLASIRRADLSKGQAAAQFAGLKIIWTAPREIFREAAPCPNREQFCLRLSNQMPGLIWECGDEHTWHATPPTGILRAVVLGAG
jgi:hypothetical protein